MLQQTNGLTLFKFASFPQDGIVHAISSRRGGVSLPPYDTLNLSLSVQDDPAHVLENRCRFALALGVDPARVVTSRQVHGDEVLTVRDKFSPEAPPATGDIQITNRRGWLLSLRFADCVPLLMVHAERRVVAAVHAGWRGTLKGAARTAILALHEHFEAEPKGLWIGIGPSIGPCCYQVGPEVAQQFAEIPGAVLERASRPHLDLWALNGEAVKRAGVPPEQIEVAELCTRCHSDLFFSHRAQGYPAGRFSAAVGLS